MRKGYERNMITWEAAKLEKDNEAWELARQEFGVVAGKATPVFLFSQIAARAAELSKELKEGK